MRNIHAVMHVLGRVLAGLALLSLTPPGLFPPLPSAWAGSSRPPASGLDQPKRALPSPAAASAGLTLTRLTAAGYLTATHELIVIGQSDGAWPGVDRDYVYENLLLTLRAAYGNPVEWPGVTIEFSPLPGKPPVPPGYLPVYNFGQTDNTHHGRVTFESDRLLKAYSLGKDNVTGQVVTSTVPCYTSVLNKLVQLQQQNYQSGPVDPQRFYFEPEMVLDTAPLSATVAITQSKMTLKWAYIPPTTSNRTPNSDAAAQSFVDCFNNNYDAFAAEQAARGNTALYELRVLGEIAAAAKWIQDSQWDSVNERLEGVHYPWLNAFAGVTAAPTTTITATPAITVSATFTVGQTVITQSIYGGVDFSPPNTYNPNRPGPGQIVSTALAVRPHPQANTWGGFACSLEAAPDGVFPLDCAAVAHTYYMSQERIRDNNFDEDPPGQWMETGPFVIVSGGQATLGGFNNASETLRQDVDLPAVITPIAAAASASPLIVLTFDWGVSPVDPNPSPVDFVYARLRETDGDLISTVYTLTNKSAPVGYWQTASVDVSAVLQPYLGQSVRVSFESQTDGSGVTTFYLDNVFLDTNLFSAPCNVPLSAVTISGPASGSPNVTYSFTAAVSPESPTTPITYTWAPAPDAGQGTATASYSWPTEGGQVIAVTAQNCGGSTSDSHNISITLGGFRLYLPTVLNNIVGVTTRAATFLPVCLPAAQSPAQPATDQPGTVLRYLEEAR